MSDRELENDLRNAVMALPGFFSARRAKILSKVTALALSFNQRAYKALVENQGKTYTIERLSNRNSALRSRLAIALERNISLQTENEALRAEVEKWKIPQRKPYIPVENLCMHENWNVYAWPVTSCPDCGDTLSD